jgi:hypothetical protein
MKLSEAIRAGAKLRPQGRGGFMSQWMYGTSCAMLAAYEAVNGWPKSKGAALLVWHCHEEFGITKDQMKEVVDLNDNKCMTREEIADWVEREYESKLPQKERETDDAYTKRVLAKLVSDATDARASDERNAQTAK